jgi:hypothetical protein
MTPVAAEVRYPTDEELQGIRKTCAGGDVESADANISAALTRWKLMPGAAAGVSAAKSNLGALMDKVTASAAGNQLYETYVRCVHGLVEMHLVKANPPPAAKPAVKPAPASPVKPTQNPAPRNGGDTTVHSSNSGTVINNSGSNNSVRIDAVPTTKVAPGDATTSDAEFMFGTWCDSTRGELSFRKAGTRIEKRYRASEYLGAPAVKGDFEPIAIKVVDWPDGRWAIRVEEKDGSQTLYNKQSNQRMFSTNTVYAAPVQFWRCDPML